MHEEERRTQERKEKGCETEVEDTSRERERKWKRVGARELVSNLIPPLMNWTMIAFVF